MSNKLKKTIPFRGTKTPITDKMMKLAMEVSGAVKAEIDAKREMLEMTMRQVEELLKNVGLGSLDFAEADGLGSYFYMSIQEMLEEDAAFEVFTAIGPEAWEYTIVVHMSTVNEEPEELKQESFEEEAEDERKVGIEVMINRSKYGKKDEVLVGNGWEVMELD